MDTEQIKTRILQAMPKAQVGVESDDNVHFTARVVCDSFGGKSRLEHHGMLHDPLGGSRVREIHALTLVLKAPDEV